MSKSSVVLSLLSLIACAGLAPAQGAGVPTPALPNAGLVKPYAYTSPAADNSGAAAAVVAEKVIRFKDASFLQIEFGAWHLPKGGWVEVTSLKDGAVEPLRADDLKAREGMTAYFNGDALRVRLYAAPLSKRSWFQIKTVAVGHPPAMLPATLCGTQDSRTPSNDKRVARIILRLSTGVSWCTAWLISNVHCLATAGHCIGISNLQSATVQFNVPPSTSGGNLVNPGVQDQYVWETAASSRILENAGVGKDWGVFRTQKNSITRRHAGAVQGAFFEFVPTPAPFTNTRITGCGSAPRQRNGVQQSATGSLLGVIGHRLQYRVDTTGGSSGSPVIDAKSGKAFGVHSHGGCTTNPRTSNSGTQASHPGFAAARKRICVKDGAYTTYGKGCQGSGGIGACAIVPKAYASKMGQSASTFPHSRNGMRYQQVFLGSELGGTKEWAEICFRLDETAGGGNVSAKLLIKLGPTTKDHNTLTRTFASNWSGASTTVYNGTINFPKHSGGAKPGDFKACVKFPAHYRYTGGNLLMEIVTQSTTGAYFLDVAQGASDVTTTRAYSFSASSPTASALLKGSGLVVCFRERGTLTPKLTNTGVPAIGKSFKVNLTQAKPSSAALLSLGLKTQIPLPQALAPGCTLYATLAVLGAVATDASGNASITLPIPNARSLVCVQFANQYLVLDNVNVIKLVFTNGGEAEIGG